MLHILTRSPFQSSSLAQCAALAMENDAVLLTQDAVLAILGQNEAVETLIERGVKIYLLTPDLLARGLTPASQSDLQCVDYKGFVGLTVTHETQMKWD
ncbi:sulfurtransferase complex subunit TusB [Photobacterium aphoticum]|uniref:Sulfur relay protein TusB n=1 Tax=Photobacterium aphoticum TaxID=754436 RepID=A0A0J1GFE8_9GAMM|nr:sulfurtransferase complex subunit TusB [Photobacterium aphoticum]KLU98432.1 sulfur relay protein TusB [Photobacterium aphoticum]PSU52126.1 sulfurtransferase complex subunit TusB [Photobacterium aphoticum]GHA44525.1 protein TusB [Photobacterium aphoticum]